MSAPAGENSATVEPAPVAETTEQSAGPESDVTPEIAPEATPAKTYDEDYVSKLRKENASHRTAKNDIERERNELKSTLESLRKALDPNAAEEEDPRKLLEQTLQERDRERAENSALRMERHAERLAQAAGANVPALLRDVEFQQTLRQVDTEGDVAEQLTTAITAALEAAPWLKATPAVPPRTVTDTKSGTTPPGQVTREQLKSMSPDEIVQAKNDGRLRALLGG